MANLGLNTNRPRQDLMEKPPSQMTMRSGKTVYNRPLGMVNAGANVLNYDS